jgi:hypothetical protein
MRDAASVGAAPRARAPARSGAAASSAAGAAPLEVFHVPPPAAHAGDMRGGGLAHRGANSWNTATGAPPRTALRQLPAGVRPVSGVPLRS